MNLSEAVLQLASSDAATRQQAADFLSRQGEGVRAVAAAVAAHTGDADRVVAEFCVAALEEMGAPDHSQLPALGELLTTEHPDVVYWGATLLGRAQEDSAPYAERLVEVIAGDLPVPVRQRAVWALRQIGRAASRVAASLRELAGSLPDPLKSDVLQVGTAIES